MATRFSVFVVSVNERVRSVLPHLIERHSALHYSGAAVTPSEALEAVRVARPDVVVTDRLAVGAGDVLTWREVCQLGPRLLMLTNYLRERDITLSIVAGASAHLLAPPGRSRALLDAISRIAQGESLMPEDSVARLRATARGELGHDIDGPERVVLDLILDGATDAEIAQATDKDVNQVRGHVVSLVQKLS